MAQDTSSGALCQASDSEGGFFMIKDQMEKIYRNMPLAKIPWNMETAPEILQDLVSTQKLRPCKVIEFGCGVGNYAIYLASQGFEVTGIDISKTAIKIAKDSASQKGLPCKFIIADVLGDMTNVKGLFDFAYDWELLHHIFPPDRERYIHNVYRLIKPGGRYLSVCFSEKNSQFGGKGKYRKTPLGTVLYFSSESELVSLFKPLFHIEELKTVTIKGKFAPNKAIYAFLRKK
jgi:2-polyprenyl-3-methyl-5-hydroxy-6-metoxy-1,4-benzoquinol methylase